MMQDNIIFLGFADNKVPDFKEVKGKNYVQFGEDNRFPYKLIELYDKSAKHNAIINSKVNYIIGNGFTKKDGTEPSVKMANSQETINEVARKCEIDERIFGGYYIEVHWNDAERIGAMYHMPYQKVRSNKDNTQFMVKDWSNYNRDEPEYILAFNPKNPQGKQLFFFKEYRPNIDVYTLPDYMGALNWIETDVEISKYHLSTTKNGMFASKLISFFQGTPPEEEQKNIEKRFKRKFTGADNAGSIVITFNDDPAKAPVITDLSATDLDKHFEILNKSCQQEIFVGHSITSPMLFGVRVEGQLGGRNEMREAYEIFKNTYCNDKQRQLEQVFSELMKWWGYDEELVIAPVEPIGYEFSEATIVQFAPKAWILEKLGIDPTKYPELQAPTEQGALANVTGRQQQGLLRIVRLFTKGQLTKAQAALQLKAYGLSDADINSYLGIDEDPNTDDYFSSQNEDDRMIAEFAACGESKENFNVITKQKTFAFADDMVTELEANVLDLIKKDKRITAEVIASVLNAEVSYINTVIERLEKQGRLKSKVVKVGIDKITERTMTEPLSKIVEEKPETTSFKVMYSYEGPQDNRNRAFCARLLQLNRLYTRSEIETISKRLGYSVFDRRGGFWNDNGVIKEHCRHNWFAQLVIRKS